MSLAVTRAEANLLSVARAAVGAVPAAEVLRLLVTRAPAPARLGPTARAALADTLARGTVLALARQGGWLPDGGQRLWERHPAPPLRFGPDLVRLFSWMLTTPLGAADVAPLGLEGPLSLAEQAVVVVLLDALAGTGCDAALLRQPALRRQPLVALAFAATLGHELPLEVVPSFDAPALAPWVEGLRSLLARAWVAAELAKAHVREAQALRRMGQAQQQVLDAFLGALTAVEHHRLASFLVDAGARWLGGQRSADELTAGLSGEATLRERSEARRAAGALVRALGRLAAWDAQHRAVRFIDDGYDVAQALVRDWERLGAAGFARAGALAVALEALPSAAAAPRA